MYDYAGLDYQKLSDLVDIVSWDAYPLWHSAPDARIAAECALQHDRMRSIRKGPFLLMGKRAFLHKLAARKPS